MTYVSYYRTDFLQAPHHIARATLQTNSAVSRYVFGEHGIENVFRLRPEVGTVIALPPWLVSCLSHAQLRATT